MESLQEGKIMSANQSEVQRLTERLKRLRLLANQGSAGERDAARNLFEKLVRKYDYDLNCLDNYGAAEMREFRFHGRIEEKLLLQTVAKIFNSTQISAWSKYSHGRKIPGLIIIECTKEQEAEIRFLFDFYAQLWKEEEGKMLSAFIQKHRITPDTESERKLSSEEKSDLLRRMLAFSDADPVRRLEAHKEI